MEIPVDFLEGGKGLNPAENNSLAEAVRGLATDVAANVSAPAWSAELTVTSHEVTLAAAGWVVAVEATTATSGGAKTQQYSGTPSAGFVTVAYTAGVATLTFNATDAVTGARVVVLPYAAPTVTVP